MKKIFDIEIDCANCANLVEAAINELDGVDKASISFITGKMKIYFTEGVDSNAVLDNIIRTAKRIEPDFAIL